MSIPLKAVNVGGVNTFVPVTNEEILSSKPNMLKITTDKTSISANGSDTATITVQLQTPSLWNNDTQEWYHDNVDASFDVVIQIDGESEIVSLVNGIGTTTVTAVEACTFVIGTSIDALLSCQEQLTMEAI